MTAAFAVSVAAVSLSFACGSDGDDGDATATAGAAATADAARFAEATRAPLAPVTAAEEARDDCPTGSATFRHPSGVASLCAPFQLTAFSGVAGGAPALLLTSDQAFAVPEIPRVAVSVTLSDLGFGEGAPIGDLCTSIGGAEVNAMVAGYAARGCSSNSEGSDVLQVTIALPEGASEFSFAHVQTFAPTDSAGSPALADQIIQSLRIEG